MKVSIDIDCTPEEARKFLGLPDLDKVHQATLEAITARMREAVGEFDAESLLKSWTSGGAKSLEEMQKSFWAGFTGDGKGKDSKT
ncbi:MAG: DUF6489 family protein [Proteobacteria bacterium]|nr:DUF6489 family protein [Pseudomonadota bacterium]MDA1356189.1 DUF6489 family protein [Pseudomonadota bacterium]